MLLVEERFVRNNGTNRAAHDIENVADCFQVALKVCFWRFIKSNERKIFITLE